MKIIGFIYHPHAGQESNRPWEIVLKGDSCLLNGRKPLFVPDWTSELGVTDCLILRVSRLGKEIEPRFAKRYFDAVAPGADFVAMDIKRQAMKEGTPWTKALAFDYSLAIGEWLEYDDTTSVEMPQADLVISLEDAISEASKLMTIRQGDLIYIQAKSEPRPAHKEDIIKAETNGKETLYCKIK